MVEQLSERDIFLDFEVMKLLHAVKECKHRGQYSILTPNFDQKISLCFDKQRNLLTNVYPSSNNEATLETLKRILDLAKSSNYTSSLEVFSPQENNSEGRRSHGKYAVVDVQSYDVKTIRKGHRLNIKKAHTLGVKTTIYHNVTIDEKTLRDFYDSILFSRRIVGKQFSHTFDTFTIRKELIQKGKAALVVAEHEGKRSYVFSLLSKYNSFYYDSGYTASVHPYTAHYAQHSLIEYIKALGATSYNLGKIDSNRDENNTGNKTDKVEYYKVGFCRSLTQTEFMS